MEGLPTAGLPSQMRNYSEYVWLIKHLQETGFINTVREIWWDIRPHNNFGTVEVRGVRHARPVGSGSPFNRDDSVFGSWPFPGKSTAAPTNPITTP